MSFATDKWFKHIRGEVITEGLADIGLDEMIQKEIEAKMPEASEKGRMWVGTAWKSLDGKRVSNYGWFEGYLRNATAGATLDAFQRGDNNILLDLISTYTAQPAGKWPKAKRKFAKNVLKFNFPDDAARQVLIDFKVLEKRTWNWFISRIENVIVTLNQNPNNYDMIKTIPPSDYTAAEEVCFDYQQTREDPEQVINTFEDGSYWYDLDTYQCEMEGNRMGHCGTDQRGTLYSLRKKDPGKKASKSYITIAYNADERTIYQIKGRQNTCPPQELWRHIATFIEIMGAEKLEETGEYSNEPEEFEELGQWLDENAGISFEGSFEKRMEEFRQEVERLENDWERSEYFQQVDFDGVSIDTLDYDENVVSTWAASVSSIASKLPFDLTEEAMRTLLAVGSEDSADLALGDEIEERIRKIVQEEDRNDILDNNVIQYYTAYLIKADNYAQAFLKADNMSRLMREDREQLTKGSDTYVVLWDISRELEEYAADNFDTTDADAFGEWYKAVNEMVDDLGDSVDAIEDLLISRKLIGANQIKAFKAKIDQEFNNFAVATTRSRKGEYDIMATGLLFKTTAAEMETIVDLGFLNDFYSMGNWGYYTSEQFKTYVITKLKQKEAQAVQFAKNQMKLNFGEKYEEKIESLWDKINSSDTIKKSFYNQIFVGFRPSVPKKLSNPRPAQTVERDSAFGYKIEVILNNQTIEFFGPFLEYYDNNFELVTGAIDYALKTMISAKAKKYKTQSGNDTNLPTQEGLITEGYANFLQRLGMLIETMKKAAAGPIKDQLAKWDAEDQGESLQEADKPLDVRLYEIDYVMSYPLGQGFEITDIHNIIRAIPDVTTVRTVGNAKRSQGNRTLSLQRLKFALRGQKNRIEWVRQVLLLQIHKISPKIRIHKVDRAELISSSRQSLEESYYNSTMRQSPGRTTPLPSIQNLIDDWVEGGVMYDQPTNHNLTRYSVMMPVEDLKHLCGREPRKHGHHFDAGYQNFIQNGTRDPIYLAIGKNGRAKITGNEDDLRYAIKAGVEEVPVFISYQRQV